MTSPRQKEQRGEALGTAPVSPLAWHVVCGETQSRGTYIYGRIWPVNWVTIYGETPRDWS